MRVGESWVGQVRGSGQCLLRDFLSFSLVLYHHGADPGANTGPHPRCAAADSGRGAVGVVEVRGEYVVDLPAEDVAAFHHKGQQEADDDVEEHQAEKHTG